GEGGQRGIEAYLGARNARQARIDAAAERAREDARRDQWVDEVRDGVRGQRNLGNGQFVPDAAPPGGTKMSIMRDGVATEGFAYPDGTFVPVGPAPPSATSSAPHLTDLIIGGVKTRVWAYDPTPTDPGGTIVPIGPAEPPGGEGQYAGVGMENQNWNIILEANRTGKTDTPEYAAAYYQLFMQPRMQTSTNEEGELVLTAVMPVVPPDVAPPTYVGATGAAPAAPAAPAVPGAAPAPGGAAAVPVPGGGIIGPAIAVPGTGVRPTEAQQRNIQLYPGVERALGVIEETFPALAALGNQIAGGAGVAGNLVVSPEYQRARTAISGLIADWLYSISGATANPGEVEKRTEMVMPQIGDEPPVLQDKLNTLRYMVNSIRIGRGAAAADDPAAAPSAVAGPATGPPPASAGVELEPIDPAEAAEILRANPTPENRAYFDETYGAGAAARVLGE
ncbi:MAG TPA: hypothetical protein VFG08_10220, partial [Candidatus Polarisedimenticolia bacterium]|nr:hypothetical protein [Candidatus Polarisedimenticolia bacterium]